MVILFLEGTGVEIAKGEVKSVSVGDAVQDGLVGEDGALGGRGRKGLELLAHGGVGESEVEGPAEVGEGKVEVVEELQGSRVAHSALELGLN